MIEFFVTGQNSCDFTGSAIQGGIKLSYRNTPVETASQRIIEIPKIALTIPKDKDTLANHSRIEFSMYYQQSFTNHNLLKEIGAKPISLTPLHAGHSPEYHQLKPWDLFFIDDSCHDLMQIMIHAMGMGVGVVTSSPMPLDWGLEPNDDYFQIPPNFNLTHVEALSANENFRNSVIYRGYQKVCENFDMHNYFFDLALAQLTVTEIMTHFKGT